MASTGRWEQETFMNTKEGSDMKADRFAKADGWAKHVPGNTSRWHTSMSHTFGICWKITALAKLKKNLFFILIFLSSWITSSRLPHHIFSWGKGKDLLLDILLIRWVGQSWSLLKKGIIQSYYMYKNILHAFTYAYYVFTS